MAGRRTLDPPPGPEPGDRLLQHGYPDIADIVRHVRFDPDTGSIWLHDERAILLRSSIYGQMRANLVQALGENEARRVITTLGYKAGHADGQLAIKVRGRQNTEALLAAGLQLYGIEGGGGLHPERFDVNYETGKFYGEVTWASSVEDDVQIEQFGVAHTPACWYSVGYGTAFMSALMERHILFREVECRAVGNARCRFLGRPVDEWQDDVEADLAYYAIPALINLKSRRRRVNGSETVRPVAVAPEPAAPVIEGGPVGGSPGFTAALQMVKKVAGTDATVLFIGETGVGKEIFSRTLHRLSRRAAGPFVAVNCAAIPDDLIESELFGVERGAYTGAAVARAGRFERAHGGTLFLDEVGSLTPSAQGKLLRVLQEGEVERLGGTATRKVDVRLIAATNVDLRMEVGRDRFRADLYYRLNVFPVYIPPLRARRDDILLLANTFFAQFTARHGRHPSGFTREAVEALLSYDWPGNIRELENLVERAVVLATDGEPIHVSHLFTSGEHIASAFYFPNAAGELQQQRDGIDWNDIASRALDQQVPVDEFESALVRAALRRTGGNVAAAARLLGMTRGQIDYRLKKRSGLRTR